MHAGIAGIFPAVPLKRNKIGASNGRRSGRRIQPRWPRWPSRLSCKPSALLAQENGSRVRNHGWSAITRMSRTQHLTCRSRTAGCLEAQSSATNSLSFIDVKYGEACGSKQVVGCDCTLSWPTRCWESFPFYYGDSMIHSVAAALSELIFFAPLCRMGGGRSFSLGLLVFSLVWEYSSR